MCGGVFFPPTPLAISCLVAGLWDMDTLILVVPAITKRNDNQLLFFPGVLTYLWDTNWDTNILIWDTLTTISKE